MAVDRELVSRADRLGTSTLRLYRFNPPCLSFGRNEAALEHYDRAEIERSGIHVVRRPTGGGSVWHEHELTYAVAAPIECFGSLRAAYCAIHDRIRAALQSLGVDAALAPVRRSAGPPARSGSCFASAVGGEVLVNGRKLVGSAQMRLGTALLQHGSILLAPSRNGFAPFTGAMTLAEALGRPVTFQEVANALERAWDAPLAPSAPGRHCPPLSAAAFADPLWIWRR